MSDTNQSRPSTTGENVIVVAAARGDRDAAAPFASGHGKRSGYTFSNSHLIRTGDLDDDILVQAFVRHRLTSALDERAMIVAYLRSHGDKLEESDSGTDRACGSHLRIASHAIERGDHLSTAHLKDGEAGEKK